MKNARTYLQLKNNICEDISTIPFFNSSKTGYRKYDEVLTSREASDEYNMKVDIVQMSPREYFEACADIFNNSLGAQLNQIKYDTQIFDDILSVYKNGESLFMPILDFTKPKAEQDGRHRMYVAAKLFGWDAKQPVAVFTVKDKNKAEDEINRTNELVIEHKLYRALHGFEGFTFDDINDFREVITHAINQEFNSNHVPIIFDETGTDYIVEVNGVSYYIDKDSITIGDGADNNVLLDKIEESLIEEYLIEDIASVKARYPKIDDETFMQILSIDPTYKKEVDSVGTYGKWLLDLYGRVGDSVFVSADELTNNLQWFDTNKRYLPTDKRDVNRLKTVRDLSELVSDSEVELSHRQQVRQAQKDRKNADINKDAKKVFEDDEWVVYIPETYAASCKLGQDTTWCTASTESVMYFRNYTKDGPLYININKKNREKYQFHFESEQFMDKNDEEIDIQSFFKENPSLAEFYASVGYEEYATDFYSVLDKWVVEHSVQNEGGKGRILELTTQEIISELESILRHIKDGNNVDAFYGISLVIKDVREVPHYLFNFITFKNIELNNITYVGSLSFDNCTCDNLIIKDVDKISGNAFRSINVKNTITIDNVGTMYMRAFNGEKYKKLIIKGYVKLMYLAFNEAPKNAEVIFEEHDGWYVKTSTNKEKEVPPEWFNDTKDGVDVILPRIYGNINAQ